MTITIPVTLTLSLEDDSRVKEMLDRIGQDDFARGLSGDLGDYLYDWLCNEDGFNLEALGVDVGLPQKENNNG